MRGHRGKELQSRIWEAGPGDLKQFIVLSVYGGISALVERALLVIG